MGQLTTKNDGHAAHLTINHAMIGNTIVVPGLLNQFMSWEEI